MNGSSALSAGFTLIAVMAMCTLVGVGAGWALGYRVLGGFVGGVVGVVVGFRVVWRVYLVPMRQASLERDYSHLKPQWDDND